METKESFSTQQEPDIRQLAETALSAIVKLDEAVLKTSGNDGFRDVEQMHNLLIESSGYNDPSRTGQDRPPIPESQTKELAYRTHLLLYWLHRHFFVLGRCS